MGSSPFPQVELGQSGSPIGAFGLVVGGPPPLTRVAVRSAPGPPPHVWEFSAVMGAQAACSPTPRLASLSRTPSPGVSWVV